VPIWEKSVDPKETGEQPMLAKSRKYKIEKG
jgi:hypothetical protein